MEKICVWEIGRVENPKIWIFTKHQVDPMDAHKNKHIYVILDIVVVKNRIGKCKNLFFQNTPDFLKTAIKKYL